VCRDYFSTDSNDACQYISICGCFSYRCLLGKKQPALTFGGEVLAQKDSWISHDTYAWRYIF
ncbi:hypothetical protein, partial [Escherichia coli]|uniref:hypothetical protein n=1 Tax=Escherichia coli TaxID=562 RepID=UPI000906EF0E